MAPAWGTGAGVALQLLLLLPGLAIAQSASPPKVVVVNDLLGHFEVFVGILRMVHASGAQVSTYYAGHPKQLEQVGVFTWLGANVTQADVDRSTHVTPYGPLTSLALGTWGHTKADVVICVTPEISKGECRQAVQSLQPNLLVTFVHRGDKVRVTRPFQMKALSVRRVLVALAPHVAMACQNGTRIATNWILPIAPMPPAHTPCLSKDCLVGFVVQGAVRPMARTVSVSGYSRDYTSLWRELLAASKTQAGPRLTIKVMGKGKTSRLGVPRSLADQVLHYNALPYPEFWDQIHRSLALMPCLGSPEYLTTRLSSTIIVSIMTSTPMIADTRLLATYTFLTEDHVFLQGPQETEIDVMHRILAMSEGEIFVKRRALAVLRDNLNRKASQVLSGWLDKAAQKDFSPEELWFKVWARSKAMTHREYEEALLKGFYAEGVPMNRELS